MDLMKHLGRTSAPGGGRKTVYWEEQEELIGDLGEQGSGPALSLAV